MTRIVDQLYGFGIRKFVFLNGHGGNTPGAPAGGPGTGRAPCHGCDLKLVAFSRRNWIPRWKGGHGGGEETAAMLAIDPSCVHMEYFMPFEPKDLSPDLTFAGSFNVNCNGVSVPVPRHVDRYSSCGWYGPDSPETATKEWGEEMLKATADFCVDFIKKFERVSLG